MPPYKRIYRESQAIHTYWLYLALFLYAYSGTSGIYFARDGYSGLTSVPAGVGTRLIQLAVISSHRSGPPKTVVYNVTRADSGVCVRWHSVDTYAVDEDGWLYLTNPIQSAIDHELRVVATSPGLHGESDVAVTDVQIALTDTSIPCGPRSANEHRRVLCFGTSPLRFVLDQGHYARLNLGSPKAALCPNAMRLYAVSTHNSYSDEGITIENISLTSQPLTLNVTCRLFLAESFVDTMTRLELVPRRVSGYTPRVTTAPQHVPIANSSLPLNVNTTIIIADRDRNISRYLVTMEGDTGRLVTCSYIPFDSSQFLILSVHLSGTWPNNVTSYEVDFTVTDTTYVSGSTTSLDSARVAKIKAIHGSPTFALRPDSASMLAISPLTGIVYLNNVTTFLSYKPRLVTVAVLVSQGNVTRVISVTINIENAQSVPLCATVGSCARHGNKASCEESCGLGATRGHCVMRPLSRASTQGLNRQYATCSPDLSTCPNNICDEIEEMDPSICPQDCAYIDPTAQAEGNKKTGRGLYGGKGICTCDRHPGFAYKCHCNPKYNPKNEMEIEQDTSTTQSILPFSTTYVHEKVSAATIVSSGEELCRSECRRIIIACATLVCALICATIAYKIRLNLRRKHSYTATNVPPIPENGVDEVSHLYSVNWSPKPPRIHNPYLVDEKWEFPRADLQLGKVLGEGEFGLVVKGKARGIRGGSGITPVAVKMLKALCTTPCTDGVDVFGADCGTRSELQDLLSELHLLKDVHHPNVIELLGACTVDEPVYVIVEYCENGSLRNFMRRHHKNYTPDIHEYRNDNQSTITSATLLSFCWQIARGMQYLADIKVVHRDLAARNVLVTARYETKISDFGMSRDVYEADNYVKKSKGRIPVKWMAPESLYDKIYTTKSDVWTYGILLWEIATLGASPYPGIEPERLFELLKSGYRMSRPDHCSVELYAIMQKCWKTEACLRPDFATLVEIFERTLQVDMDYLDLLRIQERASFKDEYDKTPDGLVPGSPVLSASSHFTNDTYSMASTSQPP